MNVFQRLVLSVLVSGFFMTGCEDKQSGAESAKTAENTEKASPEFPDYAYKQFEGTIDGNLPVSCIIIRNDTAINGHYFYHSKNQKITLSGVINKNNDIKMTEFVNVFTPKGWDSQKTGEFSGKWENGIFKGMWKNDKVSYPFELKESLPAGSAGLSVSTTEKTYKNKGKGGAYVSYQTLKVTSSTTEAIKNAINTDLDEALLYVYSFEKDTLVKVENLEKVMQTFIDDYKKEEKEMDSEMTYKSVTEQFVEMNHRFILCIGQSDYIYSGGAHGGQSVTYLNYDLHSGKKITLKDIFIPDFEKSLNPVAEKYFRVQNLIPVGKSLEEEGYFWGEAFSINDNFALQPDGILFQYNQYEIAAYSMGSPHVFIPYTAVKPFVRPGCVLEEYIKLLPEVSAK
ncbi:MAG: RsiV family protein [Bacteroidia bacterium]|nr:RsiV family protein [Bacteroidia bacterium]